MLKLFGNFYFEILITFINFGEKLLFHTKYEYDKSIYKCFMDCYTRGHAHFKVPHLVQNIKFSNNILIIPNLIT